jgi:hypothetical protein
VLGREKLLRKQRQNNLGMPTLVVAVANNLSMSRKGIIEGPIALRCLGPFRAASKNMSSKKNVRWEGFAETTAET